MAGLQSGHRESALAETHPFWPTHSSVRNALRDGGTRMYMRGESGWCDSVVKMSARELARDFRHMKSSWKHCKFRCQTRHATHTDPQILRTWHEFYRIRRAFSASIASRLCELTSIASAAVERIGRKLSVFLFNFSEFGKQVVRRHQPADSGFQACVIAQPMTDRADCLRALTREASQCFVGEVAKTVGHLLAPLSAHGGRMPQPILDRTAAATHGRLGRPTE